MAGLPGPRTQVIWDPEWAPHPALGDAGLPQPSETPSAYLAPSLTPSPQTPLPWGGKGFKTHHTLGCWGVGTWDQPVFSHL